MTTPYLIAHKVRGEAAFDIAERLPCPECSASGCLECDDLGYWWIVSTSGHRAHPVASWNLEDLFDASDYPHEHPTMAIDKLDFGPTPDHYPSRSSPSRPAPDLVALLGYRRPTQPLKRL